VGIKPTIAGEFTALQKTKNARVKEAHNMEESIWKITLEEGGRGK